MAKVFIEKWNGDGCVTQYRLAPVPDWQTRECGAAEGAIHVDDDGVRWVKARGQWLRLNKHIADYLHYVEAAEAAARSWVEKQTHECGFGMRNPAVVKVRVAFTAPPPPTHPHTIRLPTADHDARLGCARWWP
jgi:hypothetical protein